MSEPNKARSTQVDSIKASHTTQTDLRISLLQTPLVWEDPAANREAFAQRLTTLGKKAGIETDLVLLPEMFTTGFTMSPNRFAETMDGPSIKWMADRASELDAVVCGSLVIVEAGKFFNRLIWMRPDGSFEQYDKRHLFGLAGEHEEYSAGIERLVVHLKGWRICPLVCYDLRFPVFARNDDAYDLLIFIANWPDKRAFHWSTLLKARAIENQSWVAGLNRVGADGNGYEHSGYSALIDPMGETVFEGVGETVVDTFSLSAAKLTKVREELPFLKDRDQYQIL